MEALARVLLPEMQKFFESEEGQRGVPGVERKASGKYIRFAQFQNIVFQNFLFTLTLFRSIFFLFGPSLFPLCQKLAAGNYSTVIY